MLKNFFENFFAIILFLFLVFLVLLLFISVFSLFLGGFVDGYDVVNVYFITDDGNVCSLDSFGYYDTISLSGSDVRYKPNCDNYSYVLECRETYKYSWMNFLFFHDNFYLYSDVAF